MRGKWAPQPELLLSPGRKKCLFCALLLPLERFGLGKAPKTKCFLQCPRQSHLRISFPTRLPHGEAPFARVYVKGKQFFSFPAYAGQARVHGIYFPIRERGIHGKEHFVFCFPAGKGTPFLERLSLRLENLSDSCVNPHPLFTFPFTFTDVRSTFSHNTPRTPASLSH